MLDLGERFVRVQVKTAQRTRDASALVAATASFAGLGSARHRVSYRGQVDRFAIYSPDTDRVYLVPVDECPGTVVRLRLHPMRIGQGVGVRLANDYELRRWDESAGA